jgi:hypothetical protein
MKDSYYSFTKRFLLLSLNLIQSGKNSWFINSGFLNFESRIVGNTPTFRIQKPWDLKGQLSSWFAQG